MRSHGETKLIDGKRVATPEYRSWQMMKNRCLNTRACDYHRYGGRGIGIVKRWLMFESFLADMGRRPTPAHTLERKYNNRNYAPGNCYWATRREQSRNRGSYNTVDLKTANEIRRLYATGSYRQIDIAKAFGLTQTDISQITRNVRWAQD